MRKKLALAALGAGVAFTVLPVAPAAAYCNQWFYDLTGYCNECYLAGGVYREATKDLASPPEIEIHCYA